MAANTETVEIIIEGTDNSVEAFTSATQNLEDIALQSKHATLAIRKLGDIVGAGDLVGFAADANAAADAVQKVTKQMQQGGAAGWVFNKVLLAVSAVSGFKIGKVVGDYVFETKRWNSELEAAIANIDKIQQRAVESYADMFKEGMKIEMEPLVDPQEQQAKLREWRAILGKELQGVASSVDSQSAQLAKARALKWYHDPDTPGMNLDERFKGNLKDRAASIKAAEQDLQLAVKKREELQRMVSDLDRQLDSEAAIVKWAKAQADFQEKNRQERDKAEREYWGFLAEQHEAEMERNEKRKEDISKLSEIWKSVGEEIDSFEQMQMDQDWAFVEDLKVALEELQNGEFAAKRMAAAMRGVGEEALAAGDAIQKKILAAEELKKFEKEQAKQANEFVKSVESLTMNMLGELSKAVPELQANESRFLTRGAAGSPAEDTAKNTKAIAEAVKEAKKVAEKQRDLQAAVLNELKLNGLVLTEVK